MIDKQYKELIKTFKPEFGNIMHIEINNLVNKLRLKKYKPDQIDSIKSKIIYLIKEYGTDSR